MPFPVRYDEAIQAATQKYWPDLPNWKLWKAQLAAESSLDPDAVSPAGAIGIAQFMADTWQEVTRQLGWAGASPRDAHRAIEAGAFYMAQLRASWFHGIPIGEAHWLAAASYNAGRANIAKAQKLSAGAMWHAIAPSLHLVTGPSNALETRTYVLRIWEYWQALELAH